MNFTQIYTLTFKLLKSRLQTVLKIDPVKFENGKKNSVTIDYVQLKHWSYFNK